MAATNKSIATAILDSMHGVVVFKEISPKFPEDTNAVTFLGKQGRIRIRKSGQVVRPDFRNNGRLTGGAENLLYRLRADRELALSLRQEALTQLGNSNTTVLGVEIANSDAIEGAAEF